MSKNHYDTAFSKNRIAELEERINDLEQRISKIENLIETERQRKIEEYKRANDTIIEQQELMKMIEARFIGGKNFKI